MTLSILCADGKINQSENEGKSKQALLHGWDGVEQAVAECIECIGR